jgi:iron complex transport system substrate-binding protein
MVCLSATHLSFLDALDEIDILCGVSSADYVVSPEFQTRLETGKIKEIGIGDHFKLEELINLSPEVLMVSPQKGQSFDPLVNAGLTIVPNGDFLETHPLGRVEWIKFVGLLTGKENEACQIFDSIKNEYNNLLQLTENISNRPAILSGKQYGGFWNLPGGQSYVSQFFKDAGANYLWGDNPSSGGITLDFETVYDQGMEADFWRILVYTDAEYSYQMLQDEDERYSNFKAFQNKKIIYCNTLETPYFQKGLLEPQAILSDYIHIFFPEVLPNHKNKYYKLLK